MSGVEYGESVQYNKMSATCECSERCDADGGLTSLCPPGPEPRPTQQDWNDDAEFHEWVLEAGAASFASSNGERDE